MIMLLRFISQFIFIKLFYESINAVVIRDYNKVNFVEVKSFEAFEKLFINGEKRTFSKNVFVGVAIEDCKADLESPALLGAQRHAGGDVLQVAIMTADIFPIRLEACSEAFFYRVGDNIEEPTASTTNFQHDMLNSWMTESIRVKEFEFKNDFPFAINYFWHDESVDPVMQGTLAPGKSTKVSTFIGHIFSASAAFPDDRIFLEFPGISASLATTDLPNEYADTAYTNIVDFMVVGDLRYSFNKMNRIETCELVAGDSQAETAVAAVQAFIVSPSELTCSSMVIRFLEYSHSIWHEKRLGLNFVQPQMVPAVTETGFELRRLPASTYRWLREWYDSEQLRRMETETVAGPCMNQHAAPTRMTHITPELKDRLSDELRPILEEWFGGELELTSIYGIRKYTNGSVLRMHVDTVNTHVVSAIINVDQEVSEDWQLLILDHDDNEHLVSMVPGDMVLYESAKLLHGRPDAFNGSHYDNIFIHYMPVNGWDYSWV